MEPERDAQEELSSMASSATKMANEPEQTGEERQPDVKLQDVLFSALVTSVCYWTTIFLLAIVGTYPRRHPVVTICKKTFSLPGPSNTGPTFSIQKTKQEKETTCQKPAP